MKKLTCCLFSMLTFALFSQARLVEYEFKCNSVEPSFSYTYILKMNSGNSLFYPSEYCSEEELTSRVVIEKKEGKTYYFDEIEEVKVRVIPQDIRWVLIDEHKNYFGYEVHKAETTYKGKKWVAWYCLELSISDGPFVFKGLPWLIMSVHDQENLYEFNILRLFMDPDTCQIKNDRFVEISVQKYNEITSVDEDIVGGDALLETLGELAIGSVDMQMLKEMDNKMNAIRKIGV